MSAFLSLSGAALTLALFGCSSGGSSDAVTRGVVGKASMQVHRDPATGQFVPAPPPPPAARAQGAPAGTAGLVEVPAPHGGTMVDLQRQFSIDMAATRDASGLHTHCDEAPAPSASGGR